MLRDDHSDFKWLFPFAGTAAENAAIALTDWCASFGIPQGLMSDGPTHFKNETIRRLTKALKVPHHFTLPYTPWSNGAVERLGKEILRTFRAIISELQMDFNEWPDILPMIQSILNMSPSPQRGYVSPITAFTGLKPTPPISAIVRTATSTTIEVSNIYKERLINIQALLDLCAEIHPTIQSDLQANRKRAREQASRGKLANFTEGDFVLVARSEFNKGEKLALRWRGPRRVIKALNEHVYQIEDLRNGNLQDVHASMLKFYSDSLLDEKAILSHVLQSETGMVVARLMGLEESPEGLLVQVRWKGLPASEDTYETLERIRQDVPQMLERLLTRKNVPNSLVTKARSDLSTL